MKTILKETGLRKIKALSDRYKKAKIYFHQDLDGVTTALAMKNYLENNGIDVVDAEIIQYGDKEFAVKKLDAQGDTMPVLVDFAHGKPMFVVHTDHHDSQTGVEGDTSTSFRPSRSNVATLSDIMSPKDIFPSEDITLISTVDSADFARFGLEPQDIMNFIFKLQKDKSLQQNKMALGLATNKLLLAYKNKPGFLEKLVMNSTPSLLNIFQNINKIAQQEGYASPEEMSINQQGYVQKQKTSDKVYVDDGIIVQYGGGSMFKPGSYDRYTPFKNNPDSDFLVIAWPMGLVQASCNPFKGERELKGVNLGEIAQEVLAKWEPQLKDKIIPLSTIKWISESGKSFDEDSVGFTNADLEAFYGDKVRSIGGGDEYMERLKNIMNTPSTELTDTEWKILDKLGVPAWEMIQANSGGHKCITNISALNYFGRSKRPPIGKKSYRKKEGETPYVTFTKMIQKRFVELLKEKINQSKKKIETKEFNLNENVMAGVKLTSPLNQIYPITSPYEEEESFRSSPHTGTDLGCPSGTPIYAPMDGKVQVADINYDNKCGGTITIKHLGGAFKTIYCHVKQIDVSPGQDVTKGQQIGLSGGLATDPGHGNTTGAHLHVGMKVGGRFVDPEKYFDFGQPSRGIFSGINISGSPDIGNITKGIEKIFSIY
jgi:murein DD-endopeptidase MepM/ murein hydrolase activator NlpD